jgi:hypothetical protein
MAKTNYWRPPADQIDEIWPVVESKIQAALDRSGLYDSGDAREFLVSGDWQLWIYWHGDVLDGLTITKIIQHAKERECCLIVATGVDHPSWLPHLDRIEEWAQQMRCGRMRAICRPGWERILKDRAYRKTHVELEKEL